MSTGILRLVVTLRFAHAAPLEDVSCWHGWLYESFRHPLTVRAAAKYHDEERRPPFRLGVYPTSNPRTVRVVVTLLALELLPGLTASLRPGGQVWIGGTDGIIVSIAWSEAEDPAAGMRSWGQFEQTPIAARSAVLRFLTPTVFRQLGPDGTQIGLLPLPDPGALLDSLAYQWQQWVGHVPSGWYPTPPAVNLTRARVETQQVSQRGERVAGFTGTVTLTVPHASETQRQAFAALMRSAPYLGVGVKTAFGFGQVELTHLAVQREERPPLLMLRRPAVVAGMVAD